MHLQHHRCEVAASYLGFEKRRTGQEIRLVIEAITDTRRNAPAAPLALLGIGLRDRLERQALQAAAHAIAGHPRAARIDHITDVRHGDRGLGNIGRQNDAPTRSGAEHPRLLAGRQARVERQYFEVRVAAAQKPRALENVPLAGQKDQHIACHAAPVASPFDGIDGLGDGTLTGTAVFVASAGVGRLVDDFHGIGPPRDAEYRSIAEVCRERLDVDRCRGHDEPKIGTPRQQSRQIAQQEVDVERAFVRLIDDDDLICHEIAIIGNLRQQQAIGHQLHGGFRPNHFVEAHGIADRLTEIAADFIGDARRNRPRRQTARLGMADAAVAAKTHRQAQLGELGGLPGTRLPGDDDHLVAAQQSFDVTQMGADRQFVGKLDRSQRLERRGAALLDAGALRFDGGQAQLEAIHRQSAALARVDGAGQASRVTHTPRLTDHGSPGRAPMAPVHLDR